MYLSSLLTLILIAFYIASAVLNVSEQTQRTFFIAAVMSTQFTCLINAVMALSI